MTYRIEGRVALITGASTGLGRAMAHSLGRAGAKVVLNYANNVERAEESFRDFEAEGLQGLLVRADATTEEGVDLMVSAAEEAFGAPDILVPNATCEQPLKPIEEYDWAFYQRMLDFFIKSPFLLTVRCLAHMKEQRWGRIVNIGSEVYDRGIPNFSPYVAAKGGQRGWTRSMANELAPWNIAVNMVSPGWIPVERHDSDPQEMKDDYLAGVPLGRWGVPDDIGNTVAFLCSDQGGFIAGQTLLVNGANTVC